MNYRDLFTLIIIFIIVLIIGLNFAEKGVYSAMGLDSPPQSFNFRMNKNRDYHICILGKDFTYNKAYKIGEIYGNKRSLHIKIANKKIHLTPMVNAKIIKDKLSNLD